MAQAHTVTAVRLLSIGVVLLLTGAAVATGSRSATPWNHFVSPTGNLVCLNDTEQAILTCGSRAGGHVAQLWWGRTSSHVEIVRAPGGQLPDWLGKYHSPVLQYGSQ
jgi:hypothetical protein